MNPSPFNPRLVVGMIVAGVVAFGALLLLLAFGSNLGSGRDGRGHALSVSAVGYKGLVTLVGSRQPTRLIRRTGDLATEDLVVVAIEPQSVPQDVQRLIEARRGRATLFILPKWSTTADPERSGWVRALSAGAGGGAAQALGGGIELRSAAGGGGTAVGEDILNGLQIPVPAAPQLVSGKSIEALVSPDGEGALVARLTDQAHYVVADPDLLNNQALDDPAAARAALALIDALNSTGARGVAFDLTVTGLGEAGNPSLLRLAFEPPFLAMTLALLAAAVLAGLHGAHRFGPVARERRAIAFGKAALVENSAGLIRLAGREARLGSAYAEVVRHEAARAVHAPAGLQGGALDAYLDRLTRAGADDASGRTMRRFGLRTAPPGAMPTGVEAKRSFSELAGDVAAASDRHQLMAAAKALARWKRAVVR